MMLLDNAVRADKSGRERQGWIDAMRGFAIFLVVVGHIEMFMLEPVEESVLVRIIYLFLVMSANRGVESPNPASAGFAM